MSVRRSTPTAARVPRSWSPTISTRTSGIPELVVDGVTGSLAEPADPVALATAIEEILDDYEAAESRAGEGRRLVEREYEIRENVRRLLQAIAGVER